MLPEENWQRFFEKT